MRRHRPIYFRPCPHSNNTRGPDTERADPPSRRERKTELQLRKRKKGQSERLTHRRKRPGQHRHRKRSLLRCQAAIRGGSTPILQVPHNGAFERFSRTQSFSARQFGPTRGRRRPPHRGPHSRLTSAAECLEPEEGEGGRGAEFHCRTRPETRRGNVTCVAERDGKVRQVFRC